MGMAAPAPINDIGANITERHGGDGSNESQTLRRSAPEISVSVRIRIPIELVEGGGGDRTFVEHLLTS